MITTVSGNTTSESGYLSKIKQTQTQTESEAAAQESAVTQDTVELGTKTTGKVTYSASDAKKLSDTEIAQLKAQADRSTEILKSLVEKLILKQGSTANLTQSLLNITNPSDTQDAADSIAEDGEYGIEAISDRLVDFAKAISGSDKSKLSELKDAIDEGFSQATKAWGGELPGICRQTYDRTMEKLNAWSEEE